MADRPLINRLLSYQPYLDTYHGYLEELLDGPFAVDKMNSRIDELPALVRPYVQADELKLFSTEQFELGFQEDVIQGGGFIRPTALGLKPFIEERSESVSEQLAGTRKSSPGDGSGNGGSFRPGPPPGLLRPLPAPASGPAIYVSGISSEEAADNIGKRTTVCGLVTEIRFIVQAPHQPHILVMEDTGFAIEIANADAAKFQGDPKDIYKGKTVCATGEVSMSRFGNPILIVRDPSEIKVTDGGS